MPWPLVRLAERAAAERGITPAEVFRIVQEEKTAEIKRNHFIIRRGAHRIIAQFTFTSLTTDIDSLSE